MARLASLAAALLAQGPPVALPGATIDVGLDPRAVVCGDLNADGLLDVVIAHQGAGDLAVYFATGGGGFGPPVFLATGGDPNSLALPDLDADGRSDVLALHSQLLSVVTVFLVTPSGFGPKVETSLGGIFGAAPRIGDADGDGKLDLFFRRPGSIAWMSGNGAGGFSPPTEVPTVNSANTSFAVGDLNNDGKLDYVVAGTGGAPAPSNSLWVFLGDGIGNFWKSSSLVWSFGLGTGGAPVPGPVELVDVSLDGALDLIVGLSSAAPSQVVLHAGLATGILAPVPFQSLPPLEGFAGPLRPRDLDGDGRIDLIYGGGGKLRLARGLASGLLASPMNVAESLGPTPLDLGDFTGDGIADLVLAQSDFNRVFAAAAQPGAAFCAPVLDTGGTPQGVAIADFQGDGRPDVAVVSLETSTLSVFLATGPGVFSAKKDLTTGSLPRAVAAADLDGDGNADLVAVGSLSGKIRRFLGAGNGAFGAAADFPAGSLARAIALADLDGDGALDALVTNAGASTLSRLAGDGAGGFLAKVDTPVGGAPSAVVCADFDVDGRLDVATAGSESGTITVLLGDGAGSFTARIEIPTVASPMSVVAVDLNQDGRPDLVAGSSEGSGFALHLSSPAGGLAPAVVTSAPDLGGAVAFGDFDANGSPDLAVSGRDSTGSIFLGDSTGDLPERAVFLAGPSPISEWAVADLDADGRLDLLGGGSVVSVLRNSTAFAAGVAPFGTGSKGCAGLHGVNASESPKVGAGGFRLLCTNAPPGAVGLGLASNASDAFGSDPLSLGILMHVKLLGATQLLAFDLRADAQGQASGPLPIPNLPSLAGTKAALQAIWVWSSCSPSLYGLSSSPGLSVAVLP